MLLKFSVVLASGYITCVHFFEFHLTAYLRLVYWNCVFLEWSLFSISSKFELKLELWTIKFYIISIFKEKSDSFDWKCQKLKGSLFIAMRQKQIVIQIMTIWCDFPLFVALIPDLKSSILITTPPLINSFFKIKDIT